jgi:hypothetical protein
MTEWLRVRSDRCVDKENNVSVSVTQISDK